MTFLDGLPTVLSCCFCCFLRAGTIVISIFSFTMGILFVPNISLATGFWRVSGVLSVNNFGERTENTVQFIFGWASLLLCVSSLLLLLGVCLNMYNLILWYQYGAILYGAIVLFMFSILAILCFFVYGNYQTGAVLLLLMVLDVACTSYFVLVANSLRVSIRFVVNEYRVNDDNGTVKDTVKKEKSPKISTTKETRKK